MMSKIANSDLVGKKREVRSAQWDYESAAKNQFDKTNESFNKINAGVDKMMARLFKNFPSGPNSWSLGGK